MKQEETDKRANRTSVWTWLPNVITGLTLIVLFITLMIMRNQLIQANKQFIQVNQGYLKIHPYLNLSVDELDRIIAVGPDKIIKPDSTFNAFNYSVKMINVGNLPLQYEVKSFDVYINEELYSTPFKETDNTIGILYPSQDARFRRESVYFDKLQHKAIPFSDIQKMKIRTSIKIEYGGTNDKEKIVDRSLTWKIYGNIAKFTWSSWKDKW